jgi:sarcosine oxidase subunit gamma
VSRADTLATGDRAGDAATLLLERRAGRALFGCKGPRAAEWLAAQGLALPAAANTWAGAAVPGDAGSGAGGLIVARLGSSEFFLEEDARGGRIGAIAAAFAADTPAGVYPVLREDAAFALSGSGTEDFLAQVCNVHFAALDLAASPVIMTLMVGVAVLILPQVAAGGRLYRIWCDPTFGPYLGAALGGVALESGGTYRGIEQ